MLEFKYIRSQYGCDGYLILIKEIRMEMDRRPRVRMSKLPMSSIKGDINDYYEIEDGVEGGSSCEVGDHD